MAIFFYSEANNFIDLKKRLLKRWLNKVIIENGRKAGEISIILCSDEQLLEINQTYLKHFYFTDVITFNFNQKLVVNGDVYISIDRIKENAVSFKTPFMKELHRVMVHGILHLVGFDDKTKAQKIIMKQMEDHYLKFIEEEK